MRKTVNCFIPLGESIVTEKTINTLKEHASVNQIYLLSTDPNHTHPPFEGCQLLPVKDFTSSDTMRIIADKADTQFTLLYTKTSLLEMSYKALERMLVYLSDHKVGMVYADHDEVIDGERRKHPVIAYQTGSVRDDFDFGSVLLFNTECFAAGVWNLSRSDDYSYAALYSIRLFINRYADLIHIPETLYTEIGEDKRLSGEKLFDYVNPRNREVQIEMEQAFTAYLKEDDIYLAGNAKRVNLEEGQFAYQASVIIPVRNRARTIEDAIRSAVSQETNFPFNILIVDNHSTDGTSEIIDRYADRVIHICPERTDLGIGGCWDLAVHHPLCGRFAVQLDSDDLYSDAHTLQTIVDTFYKEQCAMVIGSYRMTDFELNTIAPGVIDHKEWTEKNGRNNALRINGLGAPRAFFTPVLREINIPNVSYGEDYALGLALSRDYKIGRIYDVLYLCRRWDGNSDAALSIHQINANNYFKDRLRSIELQIRRTMIHEKKHQRTEKQKLNYFVTEQLQNWELAQQNHEVLKDLKSKTVELNGFPFTVQYNPARIISTSAQVDAESISHRPCFLCMQNQPNEQKRTIFSKTLDLCVNPYPILPYHLTLPSTKHIEQQLSEDLYDEVNSEIVCFNPEFAFFYNGAHCGASAPDHLHFQAVRKEDVPLVNHIEELVQTSQLIKHEYTFYDEDENRELIDQSYVSFMRIYLNKQYPCPIFILVGNEDDGAKEFFEVLMDMLPKKEGEKEAAINLFSWQESCNNDIYFYTAVIPRSKHRPDCYFAKGKKQLAVSPGALDMAGVIVTPRKADFDKITANDAATIIKEVGISEEQADDIARRFSHILSEKREREEQKRLEKKKSEVR